MRCELDKQFFSQNTRRLNDDKEEELLDFMRINKSLQVEFKKLGVLESVLQAFMTTMDMSLFIMAANKNVARKEDSLAAWLLF